MVFVGLLCLYVNIGGRFRIGPRVLEYEFVRLVGSLGHGPVRELTGAGLGILLLLATLRHDGNITTFYPLFRTHIYF